MLSIVAVSSMVQALYIYILQSVLNAAARTILQKQKFDSITTSIRDELHWLPIKQRIEYKLSALVFKCLRWTALPYLTEQCVLFQPTSTENDYGHLYEITSCNNNNNNNNASVFILCRLHPDDNERVITTLWTEAHLRWWAESAVGSTQVTSATLHLHVHAATNYTPITV